MSKKKSVKKKAAPSPAPELVPAPKPPSPKPEEILRERERRKLTQEQAGALIYYTLNGWQRLEYGQRDMHPALWELWLMKAKRRRRTA